MKRPQLAAGLVTLPVVPANLSMPAVAQAPLRVIGSAEGHSARSLQGGNGFVLEISG